MRAQSSMGQDRHCVVNSGSAFLLRVSGLGGDRVPVWWALSGKLVASRWCVLCFVEWAAVLVRYGSWQVICVQLSGVAWRVGAEIR